MPIFVSRKTPSFAIEPSRIEMISTTTGIVQKKYRAKWLKFEPVPGGMPVPEDVLPIKDGLARGMLDSAKEATRLKVSEALVKKFLHSHPQYGVEFVQLGAAERYLGTDHPGQELIQSRDDGSYYCTVCDKDIKKANGIPLHTNSKAHKAALFEYERNSGPVALAS